MKQTVREYGDIKVIEIQESIFMNDVEEFRNILSEHINNGCKKIVLNIENVEFLASQALGIIISTIKTLRQSGGDLKLSNISDMQKEILEMANIFKFVESYPTEKDAVKEFRKI